MPNGGSKTFSLYFPFQNREGKTFSLYLPFQNREGKTSSLYLPFQNCEGIGAFLRFGSVFCDCHKKKKRGKMNDLKKQKFLETRNVKIKSSAGPCSLWRLHGDFFRLSGSPKWPLLYLWLQSSHQLLFFIFCCGLSPSLGVWGLGIREDPKSRVALSQNFKDFQISSLQPRSDPKAPGEHELRYEHTM